MQRMKKTPMYESSTSPNDPKSYEFADFTTLETNSTSIQTTKQSLLKNKIESLYKSQLLNIQELKQEENHVQQSTETKECQPSGQVLSDCNNFQPFSQVMRLNTYQTLGAGQDYQDQVLVLTGRSSCCESTSPLNKVRKSKTILGEQVQNFSQNYFQSSKPFYYNYQQAQPSPSYQYYPSCGYFSANSEFTSDDLIELMAHPYKQNLEMLKQRVKNKSQRIL